MTAPGGRRVGRPPGQAKTGGRKAGTPNRSTLALFEKLARLGCDPDKELVRIVNDSKTELAVRVNIYALFFRYIHSVPKPAVEADMEKVIDDSPMTMDQVVQWSQYVIDHYGPKAPKPDQPTEEVNDKSEEPTETNEETAEDS